MIVVVAQGVTKPIQGGVGEDDTDDRRDTEECRLDEK